MPDPIKIRFLSWNIETFDATKYASPSHNRVMEYIARVINASKADIVSILEVKYAQAADFSEKLRGHLVSETGKDWITAYSDMIKGDECYVMFCKTLEDVEFTPYCLYPPRKSYEKLANCVSGLIRNADRRFRVKGEGGIESLNFKDGWGFSGGRRPYYATFRTEGKPPDSTKIFTIISYHNTAPLQNIQPTLDNLNTLSKSREIWTYYNGSRASPVTASIIAGDFNADCQSNQSGYTCMECYADASMVFGPGRVPYDLKSIPNCGSTMLVRPDQVQDVEDQPTTAAYYRRGRQVDNIFVHPSTISGAECEIMDLVALSQPAKNNKLWESLGQLDLGHLKVTINSKPFDLST